MKKLLLAALAALGILSAPAHAAQDQVLAFVVSNCGTLTTPYIANKYGIITMDVNGNLCSSGSGGGGSSYTVNYGTAIGVKGTPDGFKDASGNFQPFLGDTTFGQWVNIKQSFSATARNFPGCTVGASSAQCLAAATATQFIQIQNTSASATVACRWGGAAVLNSSTSVQLGAGQSASWGPNTAGVPSGALNCIASGASTPLYLEWN